MFWLALLFVFPNVVDGIPFAQNAPGTGAERSYLRAVSIMKQRTEKGRMIMLICRRRGNCLPARMTIPKWLRTFNKNNQYAESDSIHYHFYMMGKPLPFMDGNATYTFPTVAYIMAEKPYFFEGDLSNKNTFIEWLTGLDNLPIVEPRTSEDIDNLIATSSRAENCSSKYLVLMNNDEKCPYEDWQFVARVALKEQQIIPVKLHLPMPSHLAVTVFKRLPLLSKDQCKYLFLIYQDNYSVSFEDYQPNMVSDAISELIHNTEDACDSLMDNLWYPILPSLTELQLVYYSGEFNLAEMEQKWSYIWIGISGGCAVCTLAFSIFWGLNGSAFAK